MNRAVRRGQRATEIGRLAEEPNHPEQDHGYDGQHINPKQVIASVGRAPPALETCTRHRWLVEPRGESLALGRWVGAFKADLGMIGDIPEPPHVTGIALIVPLLHAAA